MTGLREVLVAVSIVAASVGGCGAGPSGRDAAVDEAVVDAAVGDHVTWPEVCPARDAPDEVDAAANLDAEPGVDASADASADAGFGCGGEAHVVVTSAYESFEVDLLDVVVQGCLGAGVDLSFEDDGMTRGLAFGLRPVLASPWPAGSHAVRAFVRLSNANVEVTGTVEITAATEPALLPRAGPSGGRIEGHLELAGDGCTIVSGTFSTPYCRLACAID